MFAASAFGIELMSPDPGRITDRFPGHARDDRRVALRHRAVIGRGWIGWRAGADFRTSPAFVVNISMGGCLLAAQEEPPAHGQVMIRLDGPILPAWFNARVIEVRRAAEAKIWAVRLIFNDSCPYELFMAVAYGQAHRDTPPQSLGHGPR